MKKIKISASVMSANFANLEKDIRLLEKVVDYLHLDIMDGIFVPNFTMGPDILKSIRKITKLPFDTHLMVTEPIRYIERFVDAGSGIIAVHYETCIHLNRTIMAIKEHKVKAAVAINPSTSVDLLDDVLPLLDMVVIMSVNPGFAGQKFIPETVNKVKLMKEKINKRKLNIDIEVDGGLDKSKIDLLTKEGANIFVGGSSLLFIKGIPLEKTVAELENL